MRHLTLIGHRETNKTGYGKAEGSIECTFKWSREIGVETAIPGQLPGPFMDALDSMFSALAVGEGFVFTKPEYQAVNEDSAPTTPG